MNSESLKLGYISRAQGLKGEVRFHTDYADFINYYKGKADCLEKSGKQLFFMLEKLRPIDDDNFVLKFKESVTREDAEALRGYTLIIDTATLPALPDSTYYMFELPGVQLTDAKLGALGVLKEVYDLPAHPVGAFDFDGKEVMFPIHAHTVLKFDRKNQTLHIQLPDGLLDVYINPNEEEDQGSED